jgi:lysophospholipase L1-like esterase
MTFPTRIFRAPVGVIVLLVCALPLLSGCDEGSLNAPEIQQSNQIDGLFNSYVAIGNSITAGFQAAGINSTTQSESFAAILADSMNTPFGIPGVSPPGCPPPIQSFPPSPPSTPCALREATASKINNVAVPGAALDDILRNVDPNDGTTPPNPRPNELTQFILGGRTQIDAALDVTPTFATVWAGNNDVLGPANAGDPALATSRSRFADQYKKITDQLTSNAPLEGAVLIGVADLEKVPGIFPGQVYLGVYQNDPGQFPSNFSVSANCAPNSMGGQGTTSEISFLTFLDFLNKANQNSGTSYVIGCANNPSSPSGTEITDPLTQAELTTLSNRAGDYNAEIKSIADGNGKLIFLNPNDAFDKLSSDIPSTPDFTSQQPFGKFFSLDGIHPSSLTHRVVAALLTQRINAAYGTNLNPPSLPPDVASALN